MKFSLNNIFLILLTIIVFAGCGTNELAKCSPKECSNSCTAGFQTDLQGCPTCECLSDACQCPDDYEPVCAANGSTYGNDCLARCDDTESIYQGHCDNGLCSPIECNLTCDTGFALDNAGCEICRCQNVSPCSCSEIYSPVCGADGRTYANPCIADCEEIEIRYEGECGGLRCECTSHYEPVCGVDGRTYENLCQIRCFGVALAHVGECDTECTPFPLVCEMDCPEGYRLDELGCPTCECGQGCLCPALSDPVCGSDGITYLNPCLASCENPRGTIVHQGPCGCEEVPCDLCEWTEFVVDDNGTCTCVCVDEPSCECPAVYDPVCGSDNITYGNACEARCEGMDILYQGECGFECTPLICDLFCPEGFSKDPYGCDICECNTEDNCICSEVWNPICGLDGRTYPNECILRCSGIESDYPGDCLSDCPEVVCEQACQYGWVIDDRGCEICECLTPEDCNCPNNQNPVCGMDQNTYNNSCLAGCAGVDIASDARCETLECPELECEIECEIEYLLTQDGCPTCECLEISSCECPDEYTPVCGSDGITYSNDCFAECEGVSSFTEEACSDPCPQFPCTRYCEFGFVYTDEGCPICECVNNEFIDSCDCPDEFSPVCGVDDWTYGNACEARCLGIEIAFEGPCAPETYSCERDYDCFNTGCFGQVCAASPVMTECDFQPEFNCLEFALCACQEGICQFDFDDNYQPCIDGL